MAFFLGLKKPNSFIFLGAILLFLAAVGGAAYFLSYQELLSVITINDVVVSVTLAETPAERTRGLSGREALPENEGMLFLFDNTDYHAFWMKDMRFPIDIIWIDANRVIADIAKNISPESFPASLVPSRVARYVLEVNAGFVDRNGIAIGDEVHF